jgi:hypothetical protein
MPLPTFSRFDGFTVDFSKIKDPSFAAKTEEFLAGEWLLETSSIRSRIDAGFYRKFVEPANKNILDIGAGLGLFSIYASPHVTTVVSVEPDNERYHLLAHLSGLFAGTLCGHSFLHSAIGAKDSESGPRITSFNSLFDYYMDNNARIDLMRINTRAVDRDALSTIKLKVLKMMCKTVLVEINETDPNNAYFEYFAVLSRAGYDVIKVSNTTMFAR